MLRMDINIIEKVIKLIILFSVETLIVDHSVFQTRYQLFNYYNEFCFASFENHNNYWNKYESVILAIGNRRVHLHAEP